LQNPRSRKRKKEIYLWFDLNLQLDLVVRTCRLWCWVQNRVDVWYGLSWFWCCFWICVDIWYDLC